jgi:hypothetical protein
MSAKDIYHDTVVRALQKDGWEITDDPLRVRIGTKRDALIDLGAERLIAAEKAGSRIAIEIKSFVRISLLKDLEDALGQFLLYKVALKKSADDSDRRLYIALRHDKYIELDDEQITDLLAEIEDLRIVTFDHESEEIVQWIN